MTADFFKQKHGYEIEGIWLPRVTSITSIVSRFPPFLKATKKFQDTADWGSLVHTAITQLLKGQGISSSRIAAPLLEAFQEWQERFSVDIVNPELNVERRVYNLEQGYAGTIDMVAQVQGRIGIVDIKTGSEITEEYFLQTAAYMAAFNANKEEKDSCEARWILRIDQYEECIGCFAKKRVKGESVRMQGGEPLCNHQWGSTKAAAEFTELTDFEQDRAAFFAAKELWEWQNRKWLEKISNYPKSLSYLSRG